MIEILGKPKLETKESIEQTAADCIKKLKININAIIEIVFVNHKKMQELNLKHRNINKPTDVLSFPLDNSKSSKILGSIVICEEIANKLNERDSALVQHGFLHLIGLDHETDLAAWNRGIKTLKEDTTCNY